MIREAFLMLVFISACSSGWWFTPPRFSGDVSPMDPDVCTTQDITFTCTLLEPPMTNFSIGFTVKNESTDGEVAVDSAHVTVINETVSQLTFYNISLENKVYDVYSHVRCYYWEVFGDKNRTLQLGATSAHIYPLPVAIQDLNCIVINYNSMRCSWNFGKDYGIHFPNVLFQWRLPVLSSAWTLCPSGDSIKEGKCIWNSTRDGYFKNENMTILLTLNQEKCGENASVITTIDTSKIVKPNPVINLIAEPINSTCIKVSWSSSNSESQNPKEHKVTMKSKRDNYTKEDRFNTTKETEKLLHYRIFCNLRPFREYRFAVSLRPIGTYSGYFSDIRECTAKTYADRPSASPEVTKGGYSWKLRECQGNSSRYVCPFWKQIKEEDENGKMMGLVGKFVPKTAPQDVIHAAWAVDSKYGCRLLKCETSYLFSIVAENENDTSINASTLEIDAAASGEVRPQFIVESDNSSKVHVSWSYHGTHAARSFTVAWCRNKNGACDDKYEVDWEVFTENTTEADIEIHSFHAAAFLYGVGVVTDRTSGGMEWEGCVYGRDAEPTREPKNVDVSEGAKDNTLIVKWDKLTCESGEPYIVKYIIKYKNLKSGEQKFKDTTEAILTLENLTEDQRYEVTVRGVTKDGLHGPESEPRIAIPVNRRLKAGAIVGITMAVLVCVIFAGVGCFCAIRRCKNKAKKAIKEAGNITLPDVTGLEYTTSLPRQDSSDSGYDMTPPPDKCDALEKLTDSAFIRPDDYHFVAGLKGSKEGMTTDLCKLDPQLLFPLSDKPNTPKNSKEPVDALQGKSAKLRLILDIPKPLAFTNESDCDTLGEDNDNNDLVKRNMDYVTARKLAKYNSELLRDKQNENPSEKKCATAIKVEVNNASKIHIKPESKCISQIADFHGTEQADVIQGDIQTISKLLTQIPCPQKLQDTKRHECKPFSITPFSSATDKTQLEHTDVQNADYVGTSMAFNQPPTSLSECLIIPGTISKLSDHSQSETTKNPPLQVSSIFQDANRRTQDCSGGYITSVVDVASKNQDPPALANTLLTQTSCCNSNITTTDQTNSLSEGNAPTDYVDSHCAFSTSFGQDITTETNLLTIPSPGVQSHCNLQNADSKPTSDHEKHVLAYIGVPNRGVVKKDSRSTTVTSKNGLNVSHARDNDGYIHTETCGEGPPSSTDAVEMYVPHCAVEDSSKPDMLASLVQSEAIALNTNNGTGTGYVISALENEGGNFSSKMMQTGDGEAKFLISGIRLDVHMSPEPSHSPSLDTYVPMNQDVILQQSSEDKRKIGGYVDETFAVIPALEVRDVPEETESRKSNNDGYVCHSALESINEKMNVPRDWKPQTGCNITQHGALTPDGYVLHTSLQGKNDNLTVVQNEEARIPVLGEQYHEDEDHLHGSCCLDTKQSPAILVYSENDFVDPYPGFKEITATFGIKKMPALDGKEELKGNADSDSGLESPELSPEMERKPAVIDTGYIACDVAMSLQQ